MNKKRHPALPKRISDGGKRSSRRDGTEGPTTGEYMPHCALESKPRHSRHMTGDFQVLGIFLLSHLPPPKDLGSSKEVCPGTPEFQVLSLPL